MMIEQYSLIKSVRLFVHGIGNSVSRGTVFVVEGLFGSNGPPHLVHPVLDLLALVRYYLKVDQLRLHFERLLYDDDA